MEGAETINWLVVNAGSSSLKVKVFGMPGEKLLLSATAERIGSGNATFRWRAAPSETPSAADGSESREKTHEADQINDHAAALQKIHQLLADDPEILLDQQHLHIAHRVVHGGTDFTTPCLITDSVLEKIKTWTPFAPLHNPVSLSCIAVASHLFPGADQYAVFDTAFHATLPEHAARYALPEALYREEKIRVYGFHGISHQYVSGEVRKQYGPDTRRIVSLHLGNGCSASAIRDGVSTDTSMGFSPLNGLVMGSRPGDLDPAIVLHLVHESGMDTKAVDHLLNRDSGLKGLCGQSDMRDIREAATAGDAAAQLAIAIYGYRIKKYIGAYSAVLNGLDALIFTGGVGEHDAALRSEVCMGLNRLGLLLDENKNALPSETIAEIQQDDAPVRILVVPTDEALEIVRQCSAIVSHL
ncbi:acetate/propionate family kinase [Flavihumibacter petaseus]|uniref:Acetate kinase n=1 Tax=Flavihumibacter petaseus NBRC 106054 TaxID=1220578 RepID=A0A0E9MWF7_9BACT|nr:acetate/propionate family kinase [Flavihumibacter petaseus]GAO41435.1 acetate kinase [Flavihumibacter petaseus NBRC 106054]